MTTFITVSQTAAEEKSRILKRAREHDKISALGEPLSVIYVCFTQCLSCQSSHVPRKLFAYEHVGDLLVRLTSPCLDIIICDPCSIFYL
jgi:hypothetical protein